MTTPHNPMEGRRVTAWANDPEGAAQFGGTGNYWQAWEQDTDDVTVEILHLGHRLADSLPDDRPVPRYPHQWAWAAYAVWPEGADAPGIYEWLAASDGWLVEGQRCPTQRAAVTAALAVARRRRDQA